MNYGGHPCPIPQCPIPQLRTGAEFDTLIPCQSLPYQHPGNGKGNLDSSSHPLQWLPLWLRCSGRFPMWCACWMPGQVRELLPQHLFRVCVKRTRAFALSKRRCTSLILAFRMHSQRRCRIVSAFVPRLAFNLHSPSIQLTSFMKCQPDLPKTYLASRRPLLMPLLRIRLTGRSAWTHSKGVICGMLALKRAIFIRGLLLSYSVCSFPVGSLWASRQGAFAMALIFATSAKNSWATWRFTGSMFSSHAKPPSAMIVCCKKTSSSMP